MSSIGKFGNRPTNDLIILFILPYIYSVACLDGVIGPCPVWPTKSVLAIEKKENAVQLPPLCEQCDQRKFAPFIES